MTTRRTINTCSTVALALAIGAFVAACSANDATAPARAGHASFDASSSTCSPDVTAPTINSVTASPNVLWPPNHKMIPVTVSWNATDNCSTPVCAISSVTSNEPVNGLGDGNTSPDWIITSASTLLLRAERSGLGTGRVYTVTVTCRDAAGNTASSSVMVTVPHDQGNNVAQCHDDNGQGDDKHGDRDMAHKCKAGEQGDNDGEHGQG